MNEWVAVKERLPEPFKPVLGYNEEEDWYVITFYDDEEGCWWDRGYKLNDPTVDYWRPLPRKEKTE